MTELDGKQLTETEMVDIIARASKEIECADAYRHFLESLGDLICDHFGGNRGHVTSPCDDGRRKMFVCDNCGKIHYKESEFKPLEECVDLFQRLTPAMLVPNGECECGAFIHEKVDDEDKWMCGFDHNECIPSDGGVFAQYDRDIEWNQFILPF